MRGILTSPSSDFIYSGLSDKFNQRDVFGETLE